MLTDEAPPPEPITTDSPPWPCPNHYMRRDADGKRCWQCVHCATRRPFYVDGEP